MHEHCPRCGSDNAMTKGNLAWCGCGWGGHVNDLVEPGEDLMGVMERLLLESTKVARMDTKAQSGLHQAIAAGRQALMRARGR